MARPFLNMEGRNTGGRRLKVKPEGIRKFRVEKNRADVGGGPCMVLERFS